MSRTGGDSVALVSVLAVGLGGAVGALSRYGVALSIERTRVDTLIVNVVGSFVFGVVFGLGIDGPALLALVVGFCGAFTTFSTFAVETVQLTEDGEWVTVVIYAGGTLVVALGAVLAGGWIASSVW